MAIKIYEGLAGQIVNLIASRPFLTAAQIRETLTKGESLKYSEQAIFKALAKLQKSSVITKSDSRYGLNMSWVENLVSFGEKIEENYYSLKTLNQFLPKPQQHFKWEFNSLLNMRNFWGHMVVVMLNSSQSSTLYSWNPHPWYYQLDPKAQDQVLKAIKLSNAKIYRMIGGSTWLDKEPAKHWKKNISYSFSSGPFKDQDSYYFSSVDNYILEIRLTPSMTRQIETCYKKAKRNENILTDFINLVSSKTRVKVKLKNSEKEASKIKDIFYKHFDLK